MIDNHASVLRLLEERGAQLHALLVRITLREEIAEELLQDLFLRLTSAPEFGVADNPFAYARTCAVRLAFDWRRRNKLRHAESLVSEPSVMDNSPLASAIGEEQFEMVLSEMEQLSATDCEIITARFLQQASYEQIAVEFACTQKQARARCSKALKRLRARLPAELAEQDTEAARD